MSLCLPPNEWKKAELAIRQYIRNDSLFDHLNSKHGLRLREPHRFDIQQTLEDFFGGNYVAGAIGGRESIKELAKSARALKDHLDRLSDLPPGDAKKIAHYIARHAVWRKEEGGPALSYGTHWEEGLDRLVRKLEALSRRRGRPRKNRTDFIVMMDRVFQHAGGITTAYWNDHQGCMESSLAAFIADVVRPLPGALQSYALSGLADEIRAVRRRQREGPVITYIERCFASRGRRFFLSCERADIRARAEAPSDRSE